MPTPLVAFGIPHLGATAGIMITASHNPAEDNGMKVYTSTGAQINAPLDQHIAASILKNQVPWERAWDTSNIFEVPKKVLPEVTAAYLARLSEQAQVC